MSWDGGREGAKGVAVSSELVLKKKGEEEEEDLSLC